MIVKGRKQRPGSSKYVRIDFLDPKSSNYTQYIPFNLILGGIPKP